MKKHIKILALSLLLGSSFQAAAEIKFLNGIVGEVNATAITHNDVERLMRLLRSNPASKGISDEQLFNTARQQLIERALLVEAAKNQGWKVRESEIDLEIQRLASIGNTTPAQLYADAAKVGWSRNAYRMNVAKGLLADRMMMNVLENVKVSDGQIRAYIEQAQKEGKALPTGSPFTVYEVQRILINVNDQNTAKSVSDRMKLIAQAIEQGATFESLARRYSQDAAAGKGGLQEINEGSEPEKVEAMLKLLQVGQTSAPIQNARNWQILKMVSKRTETNPEKIQREAVRRILHQQEQQKAHSQFVGQLQYDAVVQ